MIASAPRSKQKAFLRGLDRAALLALPYIFDFWALPHQLPPALPWRSWVVLGGRGAGKTRAGAEWVRSVVEGSTPHAAGEMSRIGLVAETYEQAREVMINGPSGILAVTPKDRRPEWISGRRMLVWPNGAQAQVFSAHDPEALRGPQFDGVWADELAKWRRVQKTWDMVQFGLRLGEAPRACVTTTPRPCSALADLLERPSTVMTHAPTQANRANLAKGFLEEIEERYGGTKLGRQEIAGEFLTDIAGAFWTFAELAQIQTTDLPPQDRIIVAVDPPVSGKATSDECGIVVAGVVMEGPPNEWIMTVIADETVSAASPSTWANAVINAFETYGADRVVAEVNQGGEMVESVIRQVSPLVPLSTVHATQGKSARAEPIAALYEQGRVRHLRGLAALEDQMCQMTSRGFEGRGSPDRVDALVWAAHELMVKPAKSWRRPQVRSL